MNFTNYATCFDFIYLQFNIVNAKQKPSVEKNEKWLQNGTLVSKRSAKLPNNDAKFSYVPFYSPYANNTEFDGSCSVHYKTIR